jgi:uncharacterized protein YndB with AHSA1/START domain
MGSARNRITPPVRDFTVTVTVDLPRERVFDYLADIANHAEFSADYVSEFRLERIESAGVGAAARKRLDFPLGKVWAESAITELERPHVIRLAGSMGRLGRIATEEVYTLTQPGQQMTRVEYSFSAARGAPADRFRELLGFRAWLRSRSRRALQRLAQGLEQDRPSTHAASVAAG